MKNLLTNNNSFCLLIDMQEKLMPTIYENINLEKNILFLMQGLEILNIPILITEQYPKGLGKTIKSVASNHKIIEKTEFSAWLNTSIKQEIIAINKKQVILIGIESHVCVLQTALQMLRHGFEVFIPEECVGSRSPTNKQNALQRIQIAGGTITNTESCFFEMLETSNHENFKAISNLLKN
jgi:nicotinamidase-related amidase